MAPTPEPKVELSRDQLLELLTEIKKPYVDPKAEAEKEKDRAQMRAQIAENEALREAREANCTHMREDNTSAVAWMQHSDGIWRGVCQRCNGRLYPGHARYAEMIKIPTRGNSIVYV